MNAATSTRVIEALTLPDATAYFTADAATLARLTQQVAGIVQAPPMSQVPSVSSGPLPELRVITAPPQVDWSSHTGFPLLMAEVRSNQREWAVASRLNRHVIVSNLSTGVVQAVAARDKGRRMPPLPPSGTGTAPDAFNAGLSNIEVVQRDLLLWMPREGLQGRLAITMLDYDLRSNTVQVQASVLGPQAPPGQVPVNRPARLAVDVDPGVLAHAGIGVGLLPASDASAPTSARLSASFKLPRTQLTVFKGAEEGPYPVRVAASLVLLKLDLNAPVVVDLAVGVLADAPEIASTFSVDLSRLAVPGHYLAYLVVGDRVSGPVPVRAGGA